MQLLDFDWPNILAGSHFWAQENRPMSSDGACVVSMGPAGHETSGGVKILAFSIGQDKQGENKASTRNDFLTKLKLNKADIKSFQCSIFKN